MKRNVVLIPVLVGIAGAIWYLESLKITPGRTSESEAIAVMGREEKAARYETAKELVNPSGFINTDPFTLAQYIGQKVILIDFWTYSCINCQRTTPYLNSWWEKYADDGLLIVGVHTPEFEFEKERENVVRAVEQFGIEYPVVQDNDYAIWRAYGNRYWPRKYLIDIDGFIVYDHIGEGAYEETEQRIQEALTERALVLGTVSEMPVIDSTVTATEVDFARINSPETYFGSARNSLLGNGTPFAEGEQTLVIPSEIKKNTLYLGGTWNFSSEFATNETAAAEIRFLFEAKNVYMVASADAPVTIRVYQDGVFVREIIVFEEQLYQLIENATYGEHELRIEIESSGLNAYTFTFG
jgi:thiol-disulfide isomerase/thioredoxin